MKPGVRVHKARKGDKRKKNWGNPIMINLCN